MSPTVPTTGNMEDQNESQTRHFDPYPFVQRLEPFYAATRAKPAEMDRLYPFMVRASFVKCFEFLLLAKDSVGGSAFFLVPSLRGLCEDLIVLGFLERASAACRQEILKRRPIHELAERTEIQARFFELVRPNQPVPAFEDPTSVKKRVEQELHQLWKDAGCAPHSNRSLPPIGNLAQKLGKPVLPVLYEYFVPHGIDLSSLQCPTLAALRVGVFPG